MNSLEVPERDVVKRAVQAVLPGDAAQQYMDGFDRGWFFFPKSPHDPIGLALSVLPSRFAGWFVGKFPEAKNHVDRLRGDPPGPRGDPD